MVPRPDPALKARAAAAHELLGAEPGIDRLELLSYVVWPSPKVEHAAPRPSWSEAERERVVELAAAGLNGYEIAHELGRPRSSVAAILRAGREQHEHAA